MSLEISFQNVSRETLYISAMYCFALNLLFSKYSSLNSDSEMFHEKHFIVYLLAPLAEAVCLQSQNVSRETFLSFR